MTFFEVKSQHFCRHLLYNDSLCRKFFLGCQGIFSCNTTNDHLATLETILSTLIISRSLIHIFLLVNVVPQFLGPQIEYFCHRRCWFNLESFMHIFVMWVDQQVLQVSCSTTTMIPFAFLFKPIVTTDPEKEREETFQEVEWRWVIESKRQKTEEDEDKWRDNVDRLTEGASLVFSEHVRTQAY